MRKLITHLSFYVLLAIIAGILLGSYWTHFALQLEPLSKNFISLIKIFTFPIIFLTVTLGIASMGDLKKVGRIGIKSLVYFEIVSTLSLAIGVVMALWLKPGNISKEGIQMQDPSKYTSSPNFHIWTIIKSNANLQVLVLAIIVGLVLNFLNKKENYLHFLGKVTHYVFMGLKYVMYLAPIAAFGGMAFAVGKYGLKSLIPLGKLMGTMYLTMALFIFIILGLLLHYYKLSIGQLIKNIKEVNFTKEGNYPITIEGNLTIHGTTQKVSSNGNLQIEEGKSIISGEFSVKIKDYGIKGLYIGDKIAPEAKIKVNCIYQN